MCVMYGVSHTYTYMHTHTDAHKKAFNLPNIRTSVRHSCRSRKWVYFARERKSGVTTRMPECLKWQEKKDELNTHALNYVLVLVFSDESENRNEKHECKKQNTVVCFFSVFIFTFPIFMSIYSYE